MRVFAGPNGSGKSTTIEAVRKYRVEGKPIDLGVYVNADDIARELKATKCFDFTRYGVTSNKEALRKFALSSGLLRSGFTQRRFTLEHRFGSDVSGTFRLKRKRYADQFAQLIAQYLCELLINARKKFSFETVFSHPSKLKLMERATNAGYKVYLYFVCTEHPATNVERVALRVKKGGHPVPEDKIVERYHRSLDLLWAAVHQSYHAFFWDNSGEESTLFAEAKAHAMEPTHWIWESREKIPYWFISHFLLAHEPGHELHELGIDLLVERL